MRNRFNRVEDLKIEDFPIGVEVKMASVSGNSTLLDSSTIISQGKGVIKIRICQNLESYLKEIEKHGHLMAAIFLVNSLEAIISTLKKYSLQFDGDTVHFSKKLQMQYNLLIKVNKATEIADTLLSFERDCDIEMTKLFNEFFISVGLDPIAR